jgi:hypothetical protein
MEPQGGWPSSSSSWRTQEEPEDFVILLLLQDPRDTQDIVALPTRSIYNIGSKRLPLMLFKDY